MFAPDNQMRIRPAKIKDSRAGEGIFKPSGIPTKDFEQVLEGQERGPHREEMWTAAQGKAKVGKAPPQPFGKSGKVVSSNGKKNSSIFDLSRGESPTTEVAMPGADAKISEAGGLDFSLQNEAVATPHDPQKKGIANVLQKRASIPAFQGTGQNVSALENDVNGKPAAEEEGQPIAFAASDGRQVQVEPAQQPMGIGLSLPEKASTTEAGFSVAGATTSSAVPPQLLRSPGRASQRPFIPGNRAAAAIGDTGQPYEGGQYPAQVAEPMETKTVAAQKNLPHNITKEPLAYEKREEPTTVGEIWPERPSAQRSFASEEKVGTSQKTIAGASIGHNPLSYEYKDELITTKEKFEQPSAQKPLVAAESGGAAAWSESILPEERAKSIGAPLRGEGGLFAAADQKRSGSVDYPNREGAGILDKNSVAPSYASSSSSFSGQQEKEGGSRGDANSSVRAAPKSLGGAISVAIGAESKLHPPGEAAVKASVIAPQTPIDTKEKSKEGIAAFHKPVTEGMQQQRQGQNIALAPVGAPSLSVSPSAVADSQLVVDNSNSNKNKKSVKSKKAVAPTVITTSPSALKANPRSGIQVPYTSTSQRTASAFDVQEPQQVSEGQYFVANVDEGAEAVPNNMMEYSGTAPDMAVLKNRTIPKGIEKMVGGGIAAAQSRPHRGDGQQKQLTAAVNIPAGQGHPTVHRENTASVSASSLGANSHGNRFASRQETGKPPIGAKSKIVEEKGAAPQLVLQGTARAKNTAPDEVITQSEERGDNQQPMAISSQKREEVMPLQQQMIASQHLQGDKGEPYVHGLAVAQAAHLSRKEMDAEKGLDVAFGTAGVVEVPIKSKKLSGQQREDSITQEMSGTASVIQVPVMSQTSQAVQQPHSRAVELQAAIDHVVKAIYQMRNVGDTNTMIELKDTGLFSGARIVVSESDTSKGQLNITIDNLTQAAKQMMDEANNRKGLLSALEEKGYIIQMLVTTTAFLPTAPLLAELSSDESDSQRQREGGSSSSGEQQQRHGSPFHGEE